jgi:UDP-3-O-[3-hydroxymyristoyl] N-acetylglucosamine deacetylase
MDGSATHFVDTIESAGRRKLQTPRKYMVIKKPLRVSSEDKYAMLIPSSRDEFIIDYSIDFSHRLLKKQSFSRPFSKDVFKNELVDARTFGFLKDVDLFMKNGMAKGVSLKNAVVLSDTEVLNEEGLRYPDEFVRHKVIDLMGDLSLVGGRIIGKLIAMRSGHTLNHMLVKEVLSRRDAWELKDPSAYQQPLRLAPAFMDKAAAF